MNANQINIANTSFRFPHHVLFQVDVTTKLFTSQTHVAQTDIQQQMVLLSHVPYNYDTSDNVLSRMKGDNLFQMSGTFSRTRFTETAEYLYQRMSQYNIKSFIHACV